VIDVGLGAATGSPEAGSRESPEFVCWGGPARTTIDQTEITQQEGLGQASVGEDQGVRLVPAALLLNTLQPSLSDKRGRFGRQTVDTTAGSRQRLHKLIGGATRPNHGDTRSRYQSTVEDPPGQIAGHDPRGPRAGDRSMFTRLDVPAGCYHDQ
jgi:hypothetical protein